MLRVRDWIKMVFWIPLAGTLLAQGCLNDLFLMAGISFCLLSYGYAINNYFDIEIDKKNNRKIENNTNPLAKGFVSKRNILMIILFLLSMPIFISFKINFIGFIIILLTAIGFTLYSVKIIRLKERPFIDIMTISIFAGFLPFLASVKLIGGIIDLHFILIAGLLALLCGNEVLAHYIRDYEEDFGNTNTTAIRIGKEKSYFVLFLFLIVSLALFEFIILKYYPGTQWWMFYSCLFILIFWWTPLRLVNEILKQRISKRNIFSYGLLIPNIVYGNAVRIYQNRIRKFFD